MLTQTKWTRFWWASQMTKQTANFRIICILFWMIIKKCVWGTLTPEERVTQTDNWKICIGISVIFVLFECIINHYCTVIDCFKLCTFREFVYEKLNKWNDYTKCHNRTEDTQTNEKQQEICVGSRSKT